MTEIPEELELDERDELYLCGTAEALTRFRDRFGDGEVNVGVAV